MIPILFTVFFGLCLGSFVSLLAYRLVREMPIGLTRSKCTACCHTLGAMELIPVLSWVMWRGKCRYCKMSVAISYPLIELTQAGLFILVYLQYGFSPLAYVLALLSVILLTMTVTDFTDKIIPDALQVAFIIVGLVFAWVTERPLLWIILGPIIGFSLGVMMQWGMRLWKKQEGLGFGDVKFLAGAGLFLNPLAVPVFFFMAGIWGICIGLVWQYVKKDKLFPFGPALAFSLFFCLLYPEKIDQIQQWISFSSR